MCIFVVDLDFFALNVALPQMASGLHTTTTDLQWVISGYLLALVVILAARVRVLEWLFGDLTPRLRQPRRARDGDLRAHQRSPAALRDRDAARGKRAPPRT